MKGKHLTFADLARLGIVPRISGGEDLEAVLGQIATDIKSLNDRAESGEDVKAEIERLTKKQAEVEALLAESKETKEPATKQLSDEETQLVEQYRASKAQSSNVAEMATAMAVAIKAAKDESDDDVEATVKRILAEHPGTTRWVGSGASPDFVEMVAKGGDYSIAEPATERKRISVGEDKGVKQIEDSKSLALFGQMIFKARYAPFALEEAEKQFLSKIQRKALAEGTGSAGGFLVPTEWMPDILGMLRAEAIVRQAGPRIVPFNKLMNQTSMSTGATAYYVAENAAITPSEPTFAEAALLTPKNLTGLVPASNFLLGDAPEAEEMVRRDLVEVLALREDLAFLRGTGGGGEPTGFRNMASITLNPLGVVPTNGFQITLPELRRFKAAFRSMNTGPIRPVMFFNPLLLTHLETLTDADGHFLADRNLLTIDGESGSERGKIDGIPYFTSTQLPANITVGGSNNATDIYLVNMREAIVGLNQELQLDVSSEASYTTDGGTTWISSFQNNQTLFRAVMRHDIAHRRPAQVVVQTGVLV